MSQGPEVSTLETKRLGQKTRRGAAWSFLQEGVTELFVFPSSMILSRLLTPREFGIAAAASFFTLLASRLAELGFGTAVFRLKEVRREHYSTVFVLNLAVGILTFGVLILISPLVSRFYNEPATGAVLPIAAIAFLIVPFSTVPALKMGRDMRFKESGIIDWVQTAVFVIVTNLMAWLGYSYLSMVYGRLAAMTTIVIGRQYCEPWMPSLRFSMPVMREIFSFGVGVHSKRLLDYAGQNLDNLIVGRLFGMATLGIYDKAFSTMNRVIVRMNTGGPGLTLRVFSLIHDDADRFRRAYAKVVLSSSLLALPTLTTLAVVAPQFMVVLFGENWRPAADPFRVLCLVGYFKVLITYASSASQAAGRVWSEVWRQVLSVVLIVVFLVLLRRFGAVGAAFGVLIAVSTLAVLMHVLLTSLTHIRWRDILAPQRPAIVCTVLVAGSVFALEVVLRRLVGDLGAWPLFIAQAALAGCVYSAFILLTPDAHVRALVTEVAEDLMPKAWLARPILRSWLGLPVIAESASRSHT